MIQVFIGYDSNEVAAYHVLAQSIFDRASAPVSIAPIKRSMLADIYHRPRGVLDSTEFSMSRFIVPALMGYKGWALFLDCDMLFRDDIAKLWELRDPEYAVQVVKHDYTPKHGDKMRGAKQTVYPRKNWSSLMLMNCAKCINLSPYYASTASGLELHRFKWVNDHDIGELPAAWNHLVGEYDYDPAAKLAHWTLGGPWWEEYAESDYAEEWFQVRDKMGL